MGCFFDLELTYEADDLGVGATRLDHLTDLVYHEQVTFLLGLLVLRLCQVFEAGARLGLFLLERHSWQDSSIILNCALTDSGGGNLPKSRQDIQLLNGHGLREVRGTVGLLQAKS